MGGWGPEVLNFLQCYEESSQIKSSYQCLKTGSRSRPTIPAMYSKVLDSPFTFLSCRRMFGHGGGKNCHGCGAAAEGRFSPNGALRAKTDCGKKWRERTRGVATHLLLMSSLSSS